MLRTIHTTCGHLIHTISLGKNRIVPHSLTGPAFIYADTTEEYYIYGLKYSKKDWKDLVKVKKDKVEETLEFE
jgi:hypothetical protein